MRFSIKVRPELDKVVAVAQEAKVSICDMQFLMDSDAQSLEALSLSVEGSDDANQYFSWLLEKSNLNADKAA